MQGSHSIPYLYFLIHGSLLQHAYAVFVIDTPCVLLQDHTPISLRYSSDGTELLHDNNFIMETKRNALESQMNILKDRMDDIEERQTRSLQSKTRKVGVYISVLSYFYVKLSLRFMSTKHLCRSPSTHLVRCCGVIH